MLTESLPLKVYPFPISLSLIGRLLFYITKVCLYNFDPFQVYIIFLIFAWKHRLWVLIRTASVSTHKLCFEQKYENYQSFFLSENFRFLEVKFSIYLNRRVFVMRYIIHVYRKTRVQICNYPEYLTRIASANSVNHQEQSDQGLHCLLLYVAACFSLNLLKI